LLRWPAGHLRADGRGLQCRCLRAGAQRMIPKSGNRFSDQIMRKQKEEAANG
jgi:hypothetical protein